MVVLLEPLVVVQRYLKLLLEPRPHMAVFIVTNAGLRPGLQTRDQADLCRGEGREVRHSATPSTRTLNEIARARTLTET